MILNKSMRLFFVTSFMVGSTVFANSMITDTRNTLNSIRSEVIKKEKSDKTAIQWTPKSIIKMAMKAKGLDSQTISSADVARPFFLVTNADQCLNTIGSTDEDIAYLQSVFTEFYNSDNRTEYRLITILHRHMMEKLGLPVTKTLKDFKKMIKKTFENEDCNPCTA